jgi:transposase InsO family protein
MVLYNRLMEKGYFTSNQLSQTQFYRLMREENILDQEASKKLRLSFAMQFVNELWQADTMHGPYIKQPDKSSKKTFLIAFIDDASRVICHAEFFYHDNTENMIQAFRKALFKRGKPDRLYFDNGSNYKSKEILQACIRLDIQLIHAPVRDGAAKGKIERFFRRFRDQFLTQHIEFDSLYQLNELTSEWVEQKYNDSMHSGIQMKPVDRFNLDSAKVKYIHNTEFVNEVFFLEEDRKVNKTNCFSMSSTLYECPVDLRGLKVQIRYDRNSKKEVIVFFKDKRMGMAKPVNLIANAKTIRQIQGE